MKLNTAAFLFVLLISTTFIQAQKTQDLFVVSVETIAGNEIMGKISYEDSAKIVLETKYMGLITIQKSDIKFQGIKNGFDEIKKNAISANIFGTSAAFGITYERLLSKSVSVEFGIGAIGLGAGFKFFPYKVKVNKFMFHTGFSGIHNFAFWDIVTIAYIPLGMSFFGEKGFNFGIDLGPALMKEEHGNNNIYPYGNIKLGYRF